MIKLFIGLFIMSCLVKASPFEVAEESEEQRDARDFEIKDSKGNTYVSNKNSMFVASYLKHAGEPAKMGESTLARLTITNHYCIPRGSEFMIFKVVSKKDKLFYKLTRYKIKKDELCEKMFCLEKEIERKDKLIELLKCEKLNKLSNWTYQDRVSSFGLANTSIYTLEIKKGDEVLTIDVGSVNVSGLHEIADIQKENNRFLGFQTFADLVRLLFREVAFLKE